jgi:uncharacterized membrane protein YdcZ (DUF606 family)
MAHLGAVILGILLLVAGLFASFYSESKTILGFEYQKTYPYQNAGIALIVVGAIIAAAGFLYRPQKDSSQPL